MLVPLTGAARPANKCPTYQTDQTLSSDLLYHVLVLQTVRDWAAYNVKAGSGLPQTQAG